MGALLRREGLYSSNLTAWHRQAERGTMEALYPKKRGPKEQKPDPSVRRIAELEKENQKLGHKLRQAVIIVEAQKKLPRYPSRNRHIQEGQGSSSRLKKIAEILPSCS